MADRGTALVAAVIGSMGVATAVFVTDPTLVPPTSWDENALDVLSAAVVVVSMFVAFTHWRRWLLGADTAQLALTSTLIRLIRADSSHRTTHPPAATAQCDPPRSPHPCNPQARSGNATPTANHRDTPP